MFIERQGNLFESGAEALVNPVNCVGVMGKGVALTFKQLYPENFERYVKACKKHELSIGTLLATRLQDTVIINLPTKYHWRDNSTVHDIEITLTALKEFLIRTKIKSIAIPALGCGCGGLIWQRQVRSLTYNILENTPNTEKILYLPQ